MSLFSPSSLLIRANRQTVFKLLINPSTTEELFTSIYHAKTYEKCDPASLTNYEYVLRITHTIKDNKVQGTVSTSSDPNQPTCGFEWILDPVYPEDWTQLNTDFIDIKSGLSVYKSMITKFSLIGGVITTITAGLALVKDLAEYYPAPVVTPETTAPVVTPETTAPVVTPETTAPVVTPETTAPVVTSIGIGGISIPTITILGVITMIVVGGIFGSVYASSYDTLLEMEGLITLANNQYENKQYEISFDTFSKVDQIFLDTAFSPDHVKDAEYLHLQSITGMGNSLQSQSNFGQIQSFSEKSEEYYLYALTFYEGKHDTENAWIGRGINAIYETPEKTLEICSMFDSINSHMCQGESYAYMYVTGKAPLEKAKEQFEIALDMAGSEKQRLKIQEDVNIIMLEIQNDIDQIYDYYKLPTE